MMIALSALQRQRKRKVRGFERHLGIEPRGRTFYCIGHDKYGKGRNQHFYFLGGGAVAGSTLGLTEAY